MGDRPSNIRRDQQEGVAGMPPLINWMRLHSGPIVACCYFVLGATWWATAQAQQVAAHQSGVAYDMAKIAPESWFYVMVAALIGGITKLLGDLTGPDLRMKGWKTAFELGAGLFFSLVAGIAVYLLILAFVPSRFEPSGPLVCVLTFIAGYGGKRTLDEILKRQNKEIAEREFPTLR